MQNPSSLSSYLQKNLAEQGLSIYELENRAFPAVSKAYTRQIVRGIKKKPNTHILRVLAKAVHIPYIDLLKAAGYITESDHKDINDRLRECLKLFFEKNIADVLCDEQMLDILKDSMKVDGENRQMLINGLRTFARGFVGDKK